jgi:ATP-dependent helicase/nuclease subunit A
VKRLVYRRTSNEQTRLLYVAATRAKRTLDLSAAPPVRADGSVNPRAGTLLARLWPALVSQDPSIGSSAANVRSSGVDSSVAGGAAALAGASATANVGSPRLQRLSAQWMLPPLPPPVSFPRLPLARESLGPPEFSWVGETARHIGTVVHSSLERFAHLTDLPDSAAIESQRHSLSHQLWRHGVPERDLPRATQIVIDALTRTVNDERGRWIFDCSHREARGELALTGVARGRLSNVVIDRSFVDSSGTRWVIDFKTSRHEGSGFDEFLQQEMERYRGQLQTYVALARGLGSEPVRAALYFPLLQRFVELADNTG